MNKLLIILLLVGLGIKTMAQDLEQETRVSVVRTDVTIKSVLSEIEQQTGFTFFYNNQLVDVQQTVSPHIERRDLPEALALLFETSEIAYRIIGKQIALYPKGSAPEVVSERGVSAQTQAQTFTQIDAQDHRHSVSADEKQQINEITTVVQSLGTVRGVVLDQDGLPLAGATILIKGNNRKLTITEANGKFELTDINLNATLVVSFIGYETLEITVDVKSEMTIRLKPSTTVLEDAVVTGVFTRAKESFTGSAVRITAEELKLAGNRSIVTSIRNIDPSLQIADNINIGSDPNQLPTLTMRGPTALPTDIRDMRTTYENMRVANQPLIILNGFEVSLWRLMDMDNSLIESITLLKDASATAMYGARGSNGVIVITTKLPKTGRLRFSYTGNMNIEAPDLTSYNLMNAHEKLAFERAAGLYEVPQNAIMEEELRLLYNKRKMEAERGVDTYWLSFPVRVGVGQRHSLGIEGGGENFRYSANLAYNNITGTMKGSSRNTLNGSMLFIYQTKKLAFRNDLSVGLNKGTNSPYESFRQYGLMNSYWAPFDENGEVQKVLENFYYTSVQSGNRALNPLHNAFLPSKNTSEYSQILNNFSIEWNITPELFVRGTLGVSQERSQTDDYLSAEHTMFDNTELARKGRYLYGVGKSFRYEGQFTLNYSKTFAQHHQLFVGLGGTITEESGEQYIIFAEGFPITSMDFLGAANMYAQSTRPFGVESIVRTSGALFNANYIFKRRYFVDISGKYEGSSQFGSSNRMAPFWSSGIGWNLHNEGFLTNNPVIDLVRLRLSYGITGSQGFSPFMAMTTFQSYGGVNYQGEQGVYLMALGNSELKWQQTYQYNLGTEWGLFQERLRFGVDVYRRLTSNTLATVNLPPSSGFEKYMGNIGEVENKGVEANINAFVIRNRQAGISWSIGGSMSHNVNTIRKISESLQAMNEQLQWQTSARNPSFLYKEGESINTIFAVQSKGIDPSSGMEIFVKLNGDETFYWDVRDQVAVGKADPKVVGNFNSIFRYKGLNISAYFYYRWGGKAYNYALAGKVENIFPYENADRRALYERWKEPGDVTRFKSVRDFTETRATSRFVMDDNTLTLQTISVGYDIPIDWVKKHLLVEYLSIRGHMEDVFYLSTIKRERGLDYPFSRKFSLSITARF